MDADKYDNDHSDFLISGDMVISITTTDSLQLLTQKITC